MNERLRMAAHRRQQLLAKCAVQRAQVAQQLQLLERLLASVDTGMSIMRRLGSHPEWLVAGAVGLVLLTPRRISAALRAGSQALRGWRALAPQLRMFLGYFR